MKSTILIIEDDKDINEMLTALLTNNGFNVENAYSGTEGLLVHSDNVDLILLDLMLPGKNGEEIIKELKEKNNVPIIVMSAIEDVNKKYGNTIIIVTHNDAIKDMADRVIYLHDGRIRENIKNTHKIPAKDLNW